MAELSSQRCVHHFNLVYNRATKHIRIQLCYLLYCAITVRYQMSNCTCRTKHDADLALERDRVITTTLEKINAAGKI